MKNLFLSVLLSVPIFGLAQLDYFVPNQIPDATYTVSLSLQFDKQIVTGEGTVSFTNNGIRPIKTIAFDATINAQSLFELKQDGKLLQVFNPDDKKQVNKPLYFILNQPVESGQKVTLSFRFKKPLMLDDAWTSWDSQILIPELWWDGIRASKKYRVKIETDQSGVLAASGRLNPETGYYENDFVNRFGIYLDKEAKVMEAEVDGVLVRVLYPEHGEQVAQLALATAKEAIPYYIDLMGFYPYTFLNVLPGGPGVWGGYPFASGMVVIHGMSLFDQGSNRHWRWITAHEIGHEYWGEYVLDGDDPPFLWIALGIYADREFSRHIGLSDVRHRNWTENYLSGVKKGYNTTLQIRPDEEAAMDFDRNNYVIHAKGFAFVSALEMVLGKETFREAYRKTLKEYGGKRLTSNEFQGICEMVSGENLDWFFDPWMRTNQTLYALVGSTQSKKEGDQYESAVTVYFDGEILMPVPVYATFEDGTVQVQMTGRTHRKTTVHFTSNAPLTGASIDPSGYLANLKEAIIFSAEELKAKIDALPLVGAGDEAYRIYRWAMDGDREQLGEQWYYLGLALFDGGYYSQARRAFYYANKYGGEDDQFITLVWLGHLYDLMNNRSKAVEYYQKALDAWKGNSISHSQYNMVINEQWVKERLETPFTYGKPITW
jgi:tetratricopeptide (TPR) repeat protein